MSKIRIRNIYHKLYKAQEEVERLTELLDKELEPYVDFECAVSFCVGDGFCLLNEHTSSVVPLAISLDAIIKKKKGWTNEMHNSNSI